MSNNFNIIPASQLLPNKLHILPLMGKPIFPGIFTPVLVASRDDIEVIELAMAADNFLGLLLVKQEEITEPTYQDLYKVGSVAKIVKKINLPDGGLNVFISTIKRFEVEKFLNETHPFTAHVKYVEDTNDKSDEVRALTRSLITAMKDVSENNPLFSEEMRLNMVNIDQPGKIADFITSILNINRIEQQKILETLDVRKRMERVLIYIKKEEELLRIQKRIQKQINDKITKSQRDYFLKEELKAIQSELGMPTDSKSKEYQRLKEAFDKMDLKGEVKEKVEEEMEKFSLMDTNSAEFIVSRNYLEVLASLPWMDPPAEDLDLTKAQQILDADHYGLNDVKERILEYMAVRKMKKDIKGSIICLVGPPGVGKTSVGKSIARALNKQFFRFSVGGMRDEAEIKGHRRTYVGAMPGKIIQGLKIVKTKDPVFMIDEIDKLGSSYQGDPSSALLEVLDPEQNVAFRDHYLDLPFDISSIFFITTANTTDSIPLPLQDRMEIIRLSGYIDQEKLMIAKRYLIPKSLQRSGLKKNDIKYDKNTLLSLAQDYAREAGMRNYEKALDKIHRKVVKENLLNQLQFPLQIGRTELEKYLGKPVFIEDKQQEITKPGLAIGLAWTQLGGATLTIEAVANPGKEGFRLTGQLGDVMQESASIAYTYVRQIASRFGINKDFFENNQIHLHIPAGATPKDGPSAGITMCTALLSLVLNKKIKPAVAMTGELSLIGRVLPIGGLKEKVIAARRHNIKEIIIPVENQKDLEEIQDYIKKGIQFHPVNVMEDVIKIVFPKISI